MSSNRVVSITGVKAACGSCSLAQLCLPAGLDQQDMERLDDLIRRRRTLHRGDHLFRAGDPLCNVYAVRSGSVKSFAVEDDGGEQIVGFHLPGELIGLDAIGTGAHRCTARAMETSSVCELPFAGLEQLAGNLPSLNHQLLRIMSQEIAREGSMLQSLGNKNAAGRLAAFLVSLSDRFGQRGFSPQEFNMSMTRHEIANYLGLAVETVSRTLTQFQDGGLVRVQGRNIRIIDMAGLQEATGKTQVEACRRGA